MELALPALAILLGALPILPLIWIMVATLRRFGRRDEGVAILSSLVLSGFISVLAALLLTRGDGPEAGMLFWLIFVGFAGVSIYLPSPPALRDALLAAIVPSLALIMCLLLLYAIPVWIGGMSHVASGSEGIRSPPVAKAFLLTAFIGFVSIPSIACTTYARDHLVNTVKAITSIDVKRIKRLEDVLRASWRIVLAICVMLGITLTRPHTPFPVAPLAAAPVLEQPSIAIANKPLTTNIYLWHGALDILSFMPLSSVDASSGIIITDWNSPSGASDERFKVVAHVHGPNILPAAIRITVFRQVKNAGEWVDAQANDMLAKQLEAKALTHATELSASSP